MKHRFGLDLSKFKKVSHDNDKAVLEHHDGHQIHIALKSLSPKLRSQLVEMKSAGGQVGMDAIKKENYDKDETKKMADGGQAQPLVSDLVSPNPQLSPNLPMEPNAPVALQQQMTPAPAPTLPESPPTPLAASPQPEQRAPATTPLAEPPKPANSDLNLMGGFGLGEQAIAARQGAEEALGKAQASAYGAATGQMQAQLKVQQALAAKQKESDDHITNTIRDTENRHIDPDRIWNNKTTAGKISTAIGLILGGFNPSGHPNAALEFFNKEIDRDVDAQKADLNNKHTMLNAYFKQYGNYHDAAEMTRLTQAGILANNLGKAAATATSQLARANALQAQSQLIAAYYPKKMLFDTQQALNSVSGGPQSDQLTKQMLQQLSNVDPAAAEKLEKHYVPGIGMASVPVPEGVRDQLVKKTNLINATEHLRDWVKENGPSISPAKRAEGQALAMELQQIYRQGVGASTSEGEQHIIDNIISSNPAAILQQITVDPKLKSLTQSMNSSLNTLKKQHGLPVKEMAKESPLSAKEQMYLQWAQNNPGDPRAQKILNKGR